jgi:ABC-2 type transport system ATP-binding protein
MIARERGPRVPVAAGGPAPIASLDRAMTLVVDGLRKRFFSVQALAGVSLEVRPDEAFGFLGANGASMTTTMRIVLGLMKADEGTVTLDWRPALREGI